MTTEQEQRLTAIIAALRRDASLARMVEAMQGYRYTMPKDKYEPLLWHMLADAAIVGARLALKESAPPTLNADEL